MAIVKPKISVVIVTYNAAKTLEKAIKSVITQTYDKIEIVIIDGKSNDDTVSVIEMYKDKIAYFISEKDFGIYDAMNKGILAAKGEWIIFLGADDMFYSPFVFDNIFKYKQYVEYNFIYGQVMFVSNKKLFGSKKTFKDLVMQNICHQGIFYRRAIFSEIGMYDLRYSILSDYDLNLKVFFKTESKTKYVPEIVALFNNKGTSNVYIDKYFHKDKLSLFLENRDIPRNNLQQFYFYSGIIKLFFEGRIIGGKEIILSWLNGKRKFFFVLLFIKFTYKHLISKNLMFK